MNIRAQAALTLAPVLLQKSSLDAEIEKHLVGIEAKDHGLYKELCYGVCRFFFTLNEIYHDLLAKPLKNKDSDIKALILVGLYQVHYLRVPDHAAINETVNGVKVLNKKWAVKLVNGVLRNFIRSEPLTLKNTADHYDHPEWLLKKIKSAWPSQWERILSNNNIKAPLTLRINQKKYSREKYADVLKEKDIGFRLSEHSDDGVTLLKASDIDTLPKFDEGACSVQDEAAQLSAALLDLNTAKHVLDACCAPGGKTCHIAERVDQATSVVALDANKKRLSRVDENLRRLKLKAHLIHAKAENTEVWWDGQNFDRILLDAPCSATGVIRRHPDIKLLRRESDIGALSTLQLLLLQKLWNTLAPGGLLVYATCSVLPEENEKVIATFVEMQADAIHLPIDASWGVERPFGRQLFPDQHDGFYYARIRKG